MILLRLLAGYLLLHHIILFNPTTEREFLLFFGKDIYQRKLRKIIRRKINREIRFRIFNEIIDFGRGFYEKI